MIDPEAVEHAGIQVVDVNRVFNDVITVVVGFPVVGSSIYASSSHPVGEAFWIVITSSVITLKNRLSTKFTTPDD